MRGIERACLVWGGRVLVRFMGLDYFPISSGLEKVDFSCRSRWDFGSGTVGVVLGVLLAWSDCSEAQILKRIY